MRGVVHGATPAAPPSAQPPRSGQRQQGQPCAPYSDDGAHYNNAGFNRTTIMGNLKKGATGTTRAVAAIKTDLVKTAAMPTKRTASATPLEGKHDGVTSSTFGGGEIVGFLSQLESTHLSRKSIRNTISRGEPCRTSTP